MRSYAVRLWLVTFAVLSVLWVAHHKPWRTHPSVPRGELTVGFLPVTPNIELLARAGHGVTKFDASSAASPLRGSMDSWNYGVGAQYRFDDKNGVRADWTKSEYSHSKADADTLAVAFVRKF